MGEISPQPVEDDGHRLRKPIRKSTAAAPQSSQAG
jgi:hypothetical protein